MTTVDSLLLDAQHHLIAANPAEFADDDTASAYDALEQARALLASEAPAPDAKESVVIALMADHADCERAHARALASGRFAEVRMHGPEAHVPAEAPTPAATAETLRARGDVLDFLAPFIDGRMGMSESRHLLTLLDALSAARPAPAGTAETLRDALVAKVVSDWDLDPYGEAEAAERRLRADLDAIIAAARAERLDVA